MTERTLTVLIVLNAMLLAAIALTFSGTTQEANAQIGGGSYLMIAGSNAAVPQQQVIYIMNQANGQVRALMVNDANGRITPIGARAIADDLRAGGGGGGRGR